MLIISPTFSLTKLSIASIKGYLHECHMAQYSYSSQATESGGKVQSRSKTRATLLLSQLGVQTATYQGDHAEEEIPGRGSIDSSLTLML